MKLPRSVTTASAARNSGVHAVSVAGATRTDPGGGGSVGSMTTAAGPEAAPGAAPTPTSMSVTPTRSATVERKTPSKTSGGLSAAAPSSSSRRRDNSSNDGGAAPATIPESSSHVSKVNDAASTW